MERIPRGIYTPEFRAEAVKLVEMTGVSVARAAKRLSIARSSLDNWVRAARSGKLPEVFLVPKVHLGNQPALPGGFHVPIDRRREGGGGHKLRPPR